MTKVLLGAYGVNYSWSGSRESHALNDVSIELEQGEILGLFGPNGSGKSTLMKIIAGIIPLNRPGCSGQVRYSGSNFLEFSPSKRAQTIAYVSSDLRLEFPLTVREVVMLGRTSYRTTFGQSESKTDIEHVRWAMEESLCWKWKDQFVNQLSAGQRQLVWLARGLAQGAKILFLDEALSQMDLNHQIIIGKVLKSLAQKGWSILLVAHDVNFALEWVNSAYFLKDGEKIFQGPMKDSATLEKFKLLYPGVNLEIGKNPVTGAPKIFSGN